MKKHFGNVTPYRVYVVKTRWICGLLSALVLVLAFCLVYVAAEGSFSREIADNDTPKEYGPGVAVAVPAPVVPKVPEVEVLVAVQQIEIGTTLDPLLVEAKMVPETALPEGVLLAKDKEHLRQMFAKTMIPSRSYIVKDALTVEKPETPFYIPQGSRAVTILVDAQSGVEGFAKPNTRVDVLWLFKDREENQKVMTIVRAARILSVGGQTEVKKTESKSESKPSTATLLVSEREAKIIELARATGKVSLSLLGEEDLSIGNVDEVVSINDLIESPGQDGAEKSLITGKFSMKDPRSGKQVRLVLNHGQWEQESAEGKTVEGKTAEAQVKEGPVKTTWLENAVPGFVPFRE